MSDSTFTIPSHLEDDPADTHEERERKREAASRWLDEQARSSRQGAIRCVSILPLDIPLVRFLTDAEVRRTHQLAQDMRDKLEAEGMDGAATLVLVSLEAGMRFERDRRLIAVDDARIAFEANGHEIYVLDDADNGEGWWPVCSCGSAELDAVGPSPTRESAVEVAAAHAADHGGAWAAHTD